MNLRKDHYRNLRRRRKAKYIAVVIESVGRLSHGVKLDRYAVDAAAAVPSAREHSPFTGVNVRVFVRKT